MRIPLHSRLGVTEDDAKATVKKAEAEMNERLAAAGATARVRFERFDVGHALGVCVVWPE